MKCQTLMSAEAIQFDGSNNNEIDNLIGRIWYVSKDEYRNFWLYREGEMLDSIDPMDWVVLYENGFVQTIDSECFQKEFVRMEQ